MISSFVRFRWFSNCRGVVFCWRSLLRFLWVCDCLFGKGGGSLWSQFEQELVRVSCQSWTRRRICSLLSWLRGLCVRWLSCIPRVCWSPLALQGCRLRPDSVAQVGACWMNRRGSQRIGSLVFPWMCRHCHSEDPLWNWLLKIVTVGGMWRYRGAAGYWGSRVPPLCWGIRVIRSQVPDHNSLWVR